MKVAERADVSTRRPQRVRRGHRPGVVWPLLVLLGVLSIGGFTGGASFVTDPTGAGLGAELSWLEGAPVDDFFLPGLFLLGVYGIGCLILMVGLIWRPSPGPLHRLDARLGYHWSWAGTIAVGAILVGWILYEFAIFSDRMMLQPILIGFGAMMIAIPPLPSMRSFYRAQRVKVGAATVLVFAVWVAFVMIALVMLDVVSGVAYAAIVAAVALLLSLVTSQWVVPRVAIDRRDLIWIGVLYLGVVGLFRLAFGVFTTDRTAPMFLSFAAGLLLGTVGPIVYTAWVRRRPLRELGLGLHNMRTTVSLALLFAGVQFSITLWGYDLPAPIEWVPLLAMSLTVGVFESVFFRGFLQGRLEASLGRGSAVVAASVLYGAYHVGYGMDPSEIAFLTGLGVVYAIAYVLSTNLLVLWPLLTPLGSFYASLDAGDLAGELPWSSILGFVDVVVVMAVAVVLARRHLRRSGERVRSTLYRSPESRLASKRAGVGDD